MSVPSQLTPSKTESASAWNDEAVKEAYRHMRINFRQHSPAVRNMVLQECMTDLDPSLGVEALMKCVESKLKLP